MGDNCETLRLCQVQSAAHTASRSALCFCLADGKPTIPSLFYDVSDISGARYWLISVPLFFYAFGSYFYWLHTFSGILDPSAFSFLARNILYFVKLVLYLTMI